jgi:hypothetical protein
MYGNTAEMTPKPVEVIHFTRKSMDPLKGFHSYGVSVVTLLDGGGADETYVSCLHMQPGAWIADALAVRDSALLIVQGRVDILMQLPALRLQPSGGMGVVLNADIRYRLSSETGAILLVVEAERLQATQAGISTPERVMGATWPGEFEAPRRQSLYSQMLSLLFRIRWRKIRRVATRLDSSVWRM